MATSTTVNTQDFCPIVAPTLWERCHQAIREAAASERHVAKRWARWLGRSKGTLENYLAGTSMPRMDDAVELAARCEAFEMKLLELIAERKRVLGYGNIEPPARAGAGGTAGGKHGATAAVGGRA